jgi:ADP-ribose pyrophosphatase YjhB (NUDIX family)
MSATEILEEVKRIKAIADVGLLYCNSGYELERYTELQHIAYKLLAGFTDRSVAGVKFDFPPSKDYPTAKVDIRGMVLADYDKVLLVKESADGKWSLPGGWADIGLTPSEVVVKELKEETGLDVNVKSLLAVFDKKMHPHPPQPFYVYKMVFHCELTSDRIEKGFDVLDVGFFSIDNLPELSENRILKSQILLLMDRLRNNERTTYFD